MVIANPMYDVVFKRLMENERVAKFFIGTLLEQNIESVEAKRIECTKAFFGLEVFPLDFIATIKTESGELKKVLIEIRKVKNQVDLILLRRRYLDEQYKNEDTYNSTNVNLPVTTIYILGFNLPEIDSPCLKVERNYKDLVNNRIINTKSDFVENLANNSFIVQVERITGKYETRLDKLLSVFEQNNFVDEERIIKKFKHDPDIEEVKTMTDILHYVGTEPEEKEQIEIEQEAWRSIHAMFGQRENVFLKALEQKNKTLIEKDNILIEKDQALTEKDQALTEKDQLIEELLRKLNEKNN